MDSPENKNSLENELTLEDELTGALIGFGATVTEAMNNVEGFVPCGNPASVVSAGLAMLNSDASEEALTKQIAITKNFIDHVSDHRGVLAHAVADCAALDANKLKLLHDLQEVAAYMKQKEAHTYMEQKEARAPEIFEWVYRSLAALEPNSKEDFSALCERAEEIKHAAAQL